MEIEIEEMLYLKTITVPLIVVARGEIKVLTT